MRKYTWASVGRLTMTSMAKYSGTCLIQPPSGPKKVVERWLHYTVTSIEQPQEMPGYTSAYL